MPPALSKRLVGLPAWAWIAVVAGGLTIGLILRARRNAEEAASTTYDEDAAAVDDPYANMYTSAGYPNEYYSIPAGSGSGYGYGQDGYEYTPEIPAWLDNPPDWFTQAPDWYESSTAMPNAVEPGQVSVTVNVPHTGINCTKPKPSRSAGHNKKWECRNGKWVAVPIGGSGQGDGGGNGGGGDKCGPRPSKPAGHNRHWACRNGKWVAVQDANAGGNSRETGSVTGGGPPDRRSGHAPPPPAHALAGTVTGGSGRGHTIAKPKGGKGRR